MKRPTKKTRQPGLLDWDVEARVALPPGEVERVTLLLAQLLLSVANDTTRTQEATDEDD